MDLKVTTGIFLDTRKKKKGTRSFEDKFPVTLRVTYMRQRKYYVVIDPDTLKRVTLNEDDFEKVVGKKPRGEYKTLSDKLNKIETDAIAIGADLKTFSFPAFEAKFLSEKKSAKDLSGAFDAKAKKEKDDGNIGTGQLYLSAKISFEKFNNNKPLQFQQITSQWLDEYEKWMTKEGKGKSTIGFYCRNLRHLLNESKLFSADTYPFGKGKYQIPTSKNTKKALNTSDISKILHYKGADDLMKARDYWVFSYLGNGINPKDISLLKRKDISGGEIHFKRAKTKRMRVEPHPIIISMTPMIKEIVKRQGSKDGDYIFPILKKEMSYQQQYRAIQDHVKFINTNIRLVAKALEIDRDVTTYVARHSFASVLMHKGVPVGFISKSLGHSGIATTENYLDGFPKSAREEYAKILTEL
jgi:integrase/recombinase XerD